MKQPTNARDLTNALAEALGLPKGTTKAVLTLEANEWPKLLLDTYVYDGDGKPIVEPAPVALDGTVGERIASVQFMIRLECFPPLESRKEPKPDFVMNYRNDLGMDLIALRDVDIKPGDKFRCYKVTP